MNSNTKWSGSPRKRSQRKTKCCAWSENSLSGTSTSQNSCPTRPKWLRLNQSELVSHKYISARLFLIKNFSESTTDKNSLMYSSTSSLSSTATASPICSGSLVTVSFLDSYKSFPQSHNFPQLFSHRIYHPSSAYPRLPASRWWAQTTHRFILSH